MDRLFGAPEAVALRAQPRPVTRLNRRTLAILAGGLVTGIKSDLPRDVIATVTEPVYDTATGRFLLIPQGSRILGKYNS